MAQVKSDIEKSLQLFGPTNLLSTDKRVYWSRLSSLVLKGDVFLWSGTHMGGGNADFTIARTALQEVRNLEGALLGLQADYAHIFDPTRKTNNREMIFAVNYELQQAQNGIFGSFLVNSIQANTLSFDQAATPTVSSVYPFVNGANRVGLNQAMITRLTTPPADQRITKTFRVMYSNAAPFAVRGVLLTKYLGTTAGTAQVDQVRAVLHLHRSGELAHDAGRRRDLADRLLLDPQAHGQRRDLHRRQLALHQPAPQRQHLVLEDLAVLDAADQRIGRGDRHPSS
jgi:hypothetical protein